MYHNNIELPKSYYENPKEYKRKKIALWKHYGVIYDDYDDLYEIYMNTMNCENCTKPFITSYDRCLDHDHITGLFRKILCQGCNVRDSHLKYPSHFSSKEKKKEYKKEYYNEHKEEIKEYREQHKEEIKEYMKEYMKEYREQHKEEIKEYREQHKEQNKVKNKEYKEQHKEELNAKRRQKLNCFFCSKQLNKNSLLDHYKRGRCPNIKPLY